MFKNFLLVTVTIVVVIALAFWTTPTIEEKNINSYEECLQDPEGAVGASPINHKPVCTIPEKGIQFFREKPFDTPPKDSWFVQSPYVYGSKEMFPSSDYSFLSASDKMAGAGDGWFNIIFFQNGYNELYYSNIESSLTLESYISNLRVRYGESYITVDPTDIREKITVNNLSGYKIVREDFTFYILKYPSTKQILSFVYRSDPNWYSQPDLVNTIQEIVYTSKYDPIEYDH